MFCFAALLERIKKTVDIGNYSKVFRGIKWSLWDAGKWIIVFLLQETVKSSQTPKVTKIFQIIVKTPKQPQFTLNRHHEDKVQDTIVQLSRKSPGITIN